MIGQTTAPNISPDTIQNILGTAPAAIANLLKKNPNLKQHLPTIIRNLQQFTLQKSNYTTTPSSDTEIKPPVTISGTESHRQENVPKND